MWGLILGDTRGTVNTDLSISLEWLVASLTASTSYGKYWVLSPVLRYNPTDTSRPSQQGAQSWQPWVWGEVRWGRQPHSCISLTVLHTSYTIVRSGKTYFTFILSSTTKHKHLDGSWSENSCWFFSPTSLCFLFQYVMGREPDYQGVRWSFFPTTISD